MTKDIHKLDLCYTINQLDNINRYVFFPFKALDVDAQLSSLSKIIYSSPKNTFDDMAVELSRLHNGIKKNEHYAEYIKLTDDIYTYLDIKMKDCFGQETIVFIDDIITRTTSTGFHFDRLSKEVMRIMIPIIGDTTLFSKSTDSENPGKIEHLPHNSMAIWHLSNEGALHSAPPITGDSRFAILLRVILPKNNSDSSDKIFAEYPSIQEINEYSIANDSIWSNLQQFICSNAGLFCSSEIF